MGKSGARPVRSEPDTMEAEYEHSEPKF